jgi:hypothetical protein
MIKVLVATTLHTVARVISPPFEFGHNRLECFFSAFLSGLMGFPVMFAFLLSPLRWGLWKTDCIHEFVINGVYRSHETSILKHRVALLESCYSAGRFWSLCRPALLLCR